MPSTAVSPLSPTLRLSTVATLRGAWLRLAVIVISVSPAPSESLVGSTVSATTVETVSSSLTVTVTDAAVTVP